MADAILFNGAAAFIGQEAGILDLLINHKGLNPANVKFVGGLSSGSLMTFSFNAAFSQDPVFKWKEFKDKFLFSLTSDQVYSKNTFPYDTGALKDFIENLTNQVNLHLIKDLPFESAILVTSIFNLLKDPVDKKVYWLTNIQKVASQLPNQTDTETSAVARDIKEHQLDIKLVNALLASTAIKDIFIQRRVFYKDALGSESTIKYKGGQDALFIDGGFSNDSIVFANYREFFKVYGEHFDNLYVISPDNVPAIEEGVKQLSSATFDDSSDVIKQQILKALIGLENLTRAFIKDLRDYNNEVHFADKIYYCTPQLNFSDPLNFDIEREQYDATIAWGESNPDKIALDLTTIPDSDLEKIEVPTN